MDGDAQEILTGKCLPDGFDHRPRGSLILPVRGSFIRAESKHLLKKHRKKKKSAALSFPWIITTA